MGLSCSLCLVIQCQMASRVPRFASDARKDASCGCWPEFVCDHRRFPRLDEISSDRFCRMHRHCVGCLRLFARAEKPAKSTGVHSSFPVFIRLSYIWAFVAALLGVWADFTSNAHGIWGASRHALTVGFLSTMVFAIGQRVLPAFSGMKVLFSTKLMLAALALLTLGCALRVSSEVLAYQELVHSAWSWLPVSAITEMTAVTLFAINLILTFTSKRPPNS